MRLAALLLLGAVLLPAQTATITYQMQPSGHRLIEKWTAFGCPARPINFLKIARAAVDQGLTVWVDRDDAAAALGRRTFTGLGLMLGQDLGAMGTGAMALNWVQASPHAKLVVAGATIIVGVVKLVFDAHAPRLAPTANQDLSPNTTGCGSTTFYAPPSMLKQFTAEVTP